MTIPKKAYSSESEERTIPLVFQHKTNQINNTKVSKIDTLPDIPSTHYKFKNINLIWVLFCFIQ